jgi:hypothetical protein
MRATEKADIAERWLLLLLQLPAKPAYIRVKIWRRLQRLGAIALKNAVYVLPASEHSQEDFHWVLKEIVDSGGEASICEARLIDGLSDTDIRTQFNNARELDYAEIVADARALSKEFAQIRARESNAELKTQFTRIKNRLAQTTAIDFFDANGRQAADGLLGSLEQSFSESPKEPTTKDFGSRPGIQNMRGRVWVTRIGVHVDRIGCAWLVRRFIDKNATFKFVPPKGYVPEPNELRFDMFEAEFTHEGDRCSFEVLMDRAGLDDKALTAIAEIIHDIDLKDEKFAREEAAGIKTLINGLCAATRDDNERLSRGGAIFDNLYSNFRRKPGGRD